jgi:membrane-bound serine protease (ClpP class)
MKNPVREIAIVLACLLVFWALAMAAEPNEPSTDSPTVKAAVIVCEDMIDDGLYKSIRRRTQIALDRGAEYLIYEINTLGGLVSAAYDISEYFLHEVGPEAQTVAYISKKAVSAGALISVGCEDIIMKERTRIGACAPMALGIKLDDVEREKIETDIRTVFVNSAQANGYPEALLRAMVTREIEVFRVANLKTGEDEFFESTDMPKDPNEYDLANKKVIVTKEQILDITAEDALEYGIARAVVKDRAGALDFLEKRDGVTFAGEPMVLKTNWSEEMVRWLNRPEVMAVLVMLAMLGVYIEFNTPGVGLPGLAAVICFTIIIGSKYLVGLANWVEVALFVLGILLLLIEFLVLPGFGIAGFSGIVCIFAGLFGMLIKNPPDKLPWPQDAVAWSDFTWGVVGLSVGFVGFIVLAWVLSKYLPRIQFLSGLILAPSVPRQDGEIPVSMTTPTESKTLSVNLGDAGEVVSILRPTGKAKFGDAIVDVVAEAEFLDKGTKVEIIEIHGNRVVVKAVGNQS